VVAICCQWTRETDRLFNKDRFAAMKPNSILVNVARGEIVDEDALADALARDHLRGVALDVYAGEFEREPVLRLWSDPRVLITPHGAWYSTEAQRDVAVRACEDVQRVLSGQPPRSPANSPA